MKIELGVYVLLVVFLVVDFSSAKNEQKRRRPIIDSVAQDSEGNYIDQIASDTISYQTPNKVTAPESHQKRYHAASDEFRKSSLKSVVAPSDEQKVHYITPEPYNNNFSHDYVHHALKTNEKSKEKSPASSFLEYSTETRDEVSAKKVSTPKRRKPQQHAPSEDYNYYFPESKRIISRTTAKPATTTKDASEKYYKPQSPGAIITKDLKTNDDANVETYHYYYPEENSYESRDHHHNDYEAAPSTFAPTTTKAPKTKFSSKKKAPVEHTSTDSYQYQPVLQRPNEYVSTDDSMNDFYPGYSTYDSKHYVSHSTPAPSTPSPIKMLKPTKKNNYYLPSSTMSPSSTARPMKIRRPSTETPSDDVKQFSVSPSPSSLPHFSSTRAPEVYKYSTPSSTVHGDFYINPSTQVTPSATPSAVDLYPNVSDQRTVVIKPKVHHFQNQHESFEPVEVKNQKHNFENYEPVKEKNLYQNQETYETVKDQEMYQNHEIYEPIKERIVYKFVPEETHHFESNKTDNVAVYSTRSPFSEAMQSADNRQVLNQSTLDIDYYKDLQKNYNYEFFTEQDAGPMTKDDDATMKMDNMYESEPIDENQTATKKNMMFQMNPQQQNDYEQQYQQYQQYQQQSSMMPMNLEDHEMPPPMTETDNEAEASKNQYFVLYSVDEEEKRQKKRRQKSKPENDVVFHHHTHEHEKGEEFQHFDSEFDSEFDSDVTNSENVRIVDPSVRGGRPIEFTKDDYLRHIKQAVVQYMKDYQPKNQATSGSSVKLKNQRYQEGSHETPYRPTKTPSASTTPSSYKHTLPSIQYKSLAPLKLSKNHYTAGRLKDAIEDLQESPQVDLTVKKHKQKPFDLSAIDVGQSYQHVSHFDHSAALKNVEEFDQTNVVNHHHLNKPKLHFSQQTYHDINNLGYNQKQKPQNDDPESDSHQTANLFKGYMLPNKYSVKGNQGGSSSFSSMNYDASKLPRIAQQHGQQQQQHQYQQHLNHQQQQGDEDDEENKVEDPIDAPIQIINGIPVANPYNIDLNTLKYMLGGIAQAEVNDQLKDFDDSPSNNNANNKFPANWKSFSPSQLGSFTSNAPVYQVYGANENSQRHKKNSGQTGNQGINNSQQSKYPLVGSMVNNYNKAKNQNNNNNNNNRQKSSGKGNNGNEPTYRLSDFSGWNQMNKKTRTEQHASPSNSHFVLRPKNKHVRDDNVHSKGSINRIRQPPTDMRPPPPVKPKAHLRLLKVL